MRPTCAWFALCDREADGTLNNPMMGDVPCCRRCAERVGALEDLRLYSLARPGIDEGGWS